MTQQFQNDAIFDANLRFFADFRRRPSGRVPVLPVPLPLGLGGRPRVGAHHQRGTVNLFC